jgi:hypothetical protein
MATLSPYAFFQEFDNNGNPLVGGKLYTYEAGTTTPKVTYTDASETIPNANPVILNSSGRADVWLGDGGYKFVLTTSADVVIKTVDNVGGTSSTAFGSDVQILTTNTTVNNTFANAALVCTSPLTLSLLAAADAGEGFYVSVRNASAGNVTIDPDASELIDGASSLTIRSGFSALVICTGTAWRSIFSFPNNAIGSSDLNSTAISGQAVATPALDDKILFGDFSASDALRKCDISEILNLVIIRNHIDGYQMSTAGGSTTMTIGAGQAANSTNAVYISLASSLNKTTSSWAVGTGNGGLDTGSIANNTFYYFYAIRRPDTGVVDVVFSINATSPTLPTNYTQFRRIGAWRTNGSGQWEGNIQQSGDEFYYVNPVADVNGIQTAITRQTPALSVPPNFLAKIRATTSGGVGVSFYTRVSEVAETDAAASISNHSLALTAAVSTANQSVSSYINLRTNASSQIAYRSSNTDASSLIYIFTHGWTDTRGKQ